MANVPPIPEGFSTLTPYLIVDGTAEVTEGGAPELLQELAYVYLGPDAGTFPPMPDPPAAYGPVRNIGIGTNSSSACTGTAVANVAARAPATGTRGATTSPDVSACARSPSPPPRKSGARA